MNEGLARYRLAAVATVTAGAIGLWPASMTPLGRAYVAFCARYLPDAPFGHHVPPLLAGFLAPIVVTVLTCLAVALAREALRQRRFALLLGRRSEPGDAPWHLLHRLGLIGRVEITSDDEVYAVCGGLIRPRIYVSRGLVAILTPEELEAVLCHERQHLRRRDPLRIFAAGLMSWFAPAFPIVRTAVDRLRIRAELDADQAALANVSVDVLAAAMIKVMRAGSAIPATPAVAFLSPTAARVAALTGQPVALPFDWRDVGISVAVAIVLVGVVVSLGTQALPLPPSCASCPPF